MLFKRCKHQWERLDSHCLGLNPPEFMNLYECALCKKKRVRKEHSGEVYPGKEY